LPSISPQQGPRLIKPTSAHRKEEVQLQVIVREEERKSLLIQDYCLLSSLSSVFGCACCCSIAVTKTQTQELSKLQPRNRSVEKANDANLIDVRGNLIKYIPFFVFIFWR
jgi:hypothetical protein